MNWEQWIGQVDAILASWGFERKQYVSFKLTCSLSQQYQAETCPSHAAFYAALELVDDSLDTVCAALAATV